LLEHDDQPVAGAEVEPVDDQVGPTVAPPTLNHIRVVTHVGFIVTPPANLSEISPIPPDPRSNVEEACLQAIAMPQDATGSVAQQGGGLVR
jgi:hypothetical protein